MIALVEGAKRQKTPNEIALDILLAAMTIIFLLATATLLPYSIYSVEAAGQGTAGDGHRAGGAPRLPDPDDDRRAALGHRHRRHGPHDPEERDRHVGPRRRGRRRRGRAAARQDRHDHPRQPSGDRVHSGAGRGRARPRRRGPAGVARRRDPGGPQHRGAGQGEVRDPRARRRERLGATFVAFTRADADERRGPERAAGPQGRRRRHRGPCQGPWAAASARRGARRSSIASRRQAPRRSVVADGAAGARRDPAQGHRQGRHPRALRASCAAWASRPS